MSVNAVMADAMTERQLQDVLIDFARMRRWLVFHDLDSRRNAAGFPDLVATRDGVLLMWELKTSKGRTSFAQKAWLAALSRVPGVDARVIRPRDLDWCLERLA